MFLHFCKNTQFLCNFCSYSSLHINTHFFLITPVSLFRFLCILPSPLSFYPLLFPSQQLPPSLSLPLSPLPPSPPSLPPIPPSLPSLPPSLPPSLLPSLPLSSQVLVLPGATSRVPSYLRETVRSLSPQPSNLYSQPERLLLAWVNYHHQQQGATLLSCDGEHLHCFALLM